MSRYRQRRYRRDRTVDVNMAPLIDMTFILLIFFLVTTSFVKEAGIEVDRPEAATAQISDENGLIVGIDARGRIFVDGQEIDLRMVRSRAERYLAERPRGGVVILADRETSSGALIQVLDACRLAGVERLSVAARQPEARP